MEAYTESWIRVLVLEIFLMILTKGRRCHWHPEGKGRGRFQTPYSAEGSPTAKKSGPNVSRAVRSGSV